VKGGGSKNGKVSIALDNNTGIREFKIGEVTPKHLASVFDFTRFQYLISPNRTPIFPIEGEDAFRDGALVDGASYVAVGVAPGMPDPRSGKKGGRGGFLSRLKKGKDVKWGSGQDDEEKNGEQQKGKKKKDKE